MAITRTITIIAMTPTIITIVTMIAIMTSMWIAAGTITVATAIANANCMIREMITSVMAKQKRIPRHAYRCWLHEHHTPSQTGSLLL